ncbi:MAG TPA: glycosyltransferase [Thermoanaerobaculia bacterium]|nr:glycosyltransferase [Thermoanaerobaculia bacterium]
MIDYSVVMEWENPWLYVSGSRQARVLSELASQMRALEARGEVLVPFDGSTMPREQLEEKLGEWLRGLQWRTVRADGAGYYGQRNLCFREARGEIILSLDSDAFPSSRWLSRMLEAFENPAIDVLSTTTWIETGRLGARIWAFCANYFPLRPDEDAGPAPSDRFFANGVAFRRALLDRFVYPDRPWFRMQCVALGSRLRAEGLTLWMHPGATLEHPAPDSLEGVLRRIPWIAHDHVQIQLDRGRGRVRAVAIAAAAVMRDLARGTVRALRHWRRADVHPIELPLVLAGAACFQIAVLMTLPLFLLRPDLIATRVRINVR